MALAELKVMALLSLVAVLFLLAHSSSRLRGLLLAALDRFDGRSLLDLATRRNMILLCHAILLLILRDAGILGAPACRCTATANTTDVTHTCYYSQERSNARSRPPNRVAAAASGAKNAAVAGDGRRLIKRQRRGARTGDAAAPCAEPEPAPAEPEQVGAPPVATKENVLVEERRSNYLLDHDRGHHRAAAVDHELQAAAANGKQSSALHFGREIIVADDDERNAGAAEVEETAEVELADDSRFDEFIANTRRTMRLESLQLVTKLSSR